MSARSLNLLVLGKGKTGSLVADVARERGHFVHSIEAEDNPDAAWLTLENLRDFDAVIDFTEPHAVLTNIEACLRSKKVDGRRNHRLVRRDGAGPAALSRKPERVSSSARTFPTA